MARDNGNAPMLPARRSLFGDMEPITRLRDEVDRLFEDFPVFRFGRSMQMPVPALEMTEAEGAYKVTAELPGIKPEDVEVTVEEGMLCISGEKKEEREEKERGFMLSERSYGAFERRIDLPTGADPSKIKAQFKDGVLKISLPKNEQAQQQKQRIAIEADGR
ncbi:Hsp20/alpha crystallin family protein [Allosphingosinicella vermicomposti]|uniref:Hsp20/alpha crystallin family protein n=1 Tax=Allosphingosinicella vermicomposti TaxID=614671 RepID=UPI000D0FE334|nr:Hsp20/alpha crystallin family protein [Allosphingosinicella vermicomposti]